MYISKNNNVISVSFGGYDRISKCPTLRRWDTGQLIQLLDLPDGTDVQFDGSNVGKRIVVNGQVAIPDILLQKTDDIRAYFRVIKSDSETTIKILTIPVEDKPKPPDYVEPEEEPSFREYVQEVLEDTKAAALAAEGKITTNEQILTQMDEVKAQAVEDVSRTKDDGINALILAKNDYLQILDDQKTVILGDMSNQKGIILTDISDMGTKAMNNIANREGAALNNIASREGTVIGNIAELESLVQGNINTNANQHMQNINNKANEYLAEMNEMKNGATNAAKDAAQSAENAAASASESDATYQKVVEIEKVTTDKINQAGKEQVENIETAGTGQLKILQEAAEGVVADREQIQQNASDIAKLQDKNAWNLIAYRKLEEAVSGINISLDDAGKEFEYRNIRVLIPKLNLTSDGGNVWVYLVKRNTTNITSNHISFMAATGIPANDSILEMSGEILRNHLWIKSYRRVGTESPTFTVMSRELNRTDEPMYQRVHIQSNFDAGTEIYVYGSN